MNCNPELLSAYYDGEVVGEQRRLVEEHLRQCADCSALLNEYRRISQSVHLMPLENVPATLEDDVFDRVLNYNRKAWWQRLAAPAVEVAAVAAAALLVVVLMSQVLPGGNAGSGPVISAATPGLGSTEVSLNSPILVGFDGKMDHNSVENAVAIDPPLQVDYLWQGENLILVPKESLRPSTTYKVSVANSARDEQGRNLRDDYSLRFTTARADQPHVAAVAANMTPASSATASKFTAVIPQSTPEATRPVSAVPTPRSTVTPKATAETTPGAQITPQVTPGVMAQTTPQPQATAEADATMAALAQMATASATKGAALAMASGTRPVTGVDPSDCDILPVRGFGRVYEQNAEVRELLGCAVSQERGMLAARQNFEHGRMLWLRDLKLIYVLNDDGTWTRFPDTWTDQEPESGSVVAPAGLQEPLRGFGKLWRERPELRQNLGWGTSREHGFVSGMQDFANGLMFWTDEPAVYVIYFGGGWERFADTDYDTEAD